MFDKKKSLLYLTILGILCCTALGFVYYQANYNPYSEPSFCNINEFIDCDSVAQTSKSVFLGVPLTYWGLFLYLFVLMLLFVDKLQLKIKVLRVFKNPYSYISTLGFISFIISICLAVISIFQIKKICILCFVTYFINLSLGIISADFKNGGIIKSFKDSFSDFISGVKEETVPFIVVIVAASVFLTWATFEMPFASRKQSIAHYMLMKHNPYKISGNYLGNPDGHIKVDLYTDIRCPVCKSYNVMLHKIVKKNKDVYVIPHEFPLDTECNPYLEKQMHRGACRMARYVIAAENQNKYWDMANALFEKCPKTEEESIILAKSLGLDVNKFVADINSKETRERIKKEIDDAISLGLDGTPNVIVNGKRCFGAKSYYELNKFIKGGYGK